MAQPPASQGVPGTHVMVSRITTAYAVTAEGLYQAMEIEDIVAARR